MEAFDFLPLWQSNDVTKIRHRLCEGIVGSKRWEELVDEVTYRGEGPNAKWMLIGQRRRDIYPLIGGKHKKWFICVQSIDNNGRLESRKFESKAGYNQDTDHIWVDVRGYVMLISGSTSVPFWCKSKWAPYACLSSSLCKGSESFLKKKST